jgi:AGZA family xanthine/uracil permease-like MFS transporter
LSAPDFSIFFQLDIMGSLKLALVPAMLSIAMTDLFDSVSTFVGVSNATGLVDEHGEPKNLRRGLIVDALATLGAGLFGTSSGTAYIESAAGIEAGARTGWASVFTGLMFLPCLFLAPIAGLVPAVATAPVLILVGALMFRSCFELKISRMEDLVPTFITIVLIPLTFSITQGILWGFLLHPLFYLLVGRTKEVRAMNYVLAILSLGLLFV